MKKILRELEFYSVVFILSVAFTIGLRVFVVTSIISIPTPSMEPAVMAGDRIIVTKLISGPRVFKNIRQIRVDGKYYRRISKNKTYSDQDTFMHLVLPARNNWNAAYWIGTNTLLRREALESIGGFPTDCVTEDVLTSMFIHGKGWKSIYIDELFAYGLAPANSSEYFVQRLRWAKGAFQIFRSHNPLFQKGLTLMQRLFYFSSVSHFFEESVKIVYYLFPAFFFLFGVVPVYQYLPVIIGMLLYVGITHLILGAVNK